MTEYAWLQVREHAIQLFAGDTPGAELEQQIITEFTASPARVTDAIEAIGRKVATGEVRSGWAILRTELAQRPTDIRVTDNLERAVQIRLAEQWIENAGGYLDRETELVDELFGDRGRLRHWASDEQPRTRVLELWQGERPRFQRAETEALERAETINASLARIRTATAQAAVKDMPEAETTTTQTPRDNIDWSTP